MKFLTQCKNNKNHSWTEWSEPHVVRHHMVGNEIIVREIIHERRCIICDHIQRKIDSQ
jgi:hypothetical protein